VGDAPVAWPARYRRTVPIGADANFPEPAWTIRSHTIAATVRGDTPWYRSGPATALIRARRPTR